MRIIAYGAILPYTYPKWICKLILAKDFLLMCTIHPKGMIPNRSMTI